MKEGVSGMEYKTIAGPIGLTVLNEEDYEDAVKKYAKIIDAEAVGGWELLWIQQIPVTKLVLNKSSLIGLTLIAAVIGGVIGAVTSTSSWGVAPGAVVGGAFSGAFIGIIIGIIACRNKVVDLFNMLVFAKRK